MKLRKPWTTLPTETPLQPTDLPLFGWRWRLSPRQKQRRLSGRDSEEQTNSTKWEPNQPTEKTDSFTVETKPMGPRVFACHTHFRILRSTSSELPQTSKQCRERSCEDVDLLFHAPPRKIDRSRVFRTPCGYSNTGIRDLPKPPMANESVFFLRKNTSKLVRYSILASSS